MKAIKRLVVGGISIYLIFIVMFYFLQEKIIFLPTTLPQNYAYSFSEYFEEIFLTAEDGARLNALWFKKEDPQGLVLYFHGNAGNLSRWGEITIPFVRKGYDVLVMDYRTYGKSTGKLSEKALYSDAQLFYDFAAEKYEEPSFAMQLLKGFSKEFSKDTFNVIEKWFPIGIRNWAHTDGLCSELLDPMLKRQIITVKDFSGWRESEYPFQRRSVPVASALTLGSFASELIR